MSESKRFEKDYSLDGWPIRDNDNQAVLNTDDLLVILNGFDEMERSINKLKAEAVESYHEELLSATKTMFHPHFEGVKGVWFSKLDRGEQ